MLLLRTEKWWWISLYRRLFLKMNNINTQTHVSSFSKSYIQTGRSNSQQHPRACTDMGNAASEMQQKSPRRFAAKLSRPISFLRQIASWVSISLFQTTADAFCRQDKSRWLENFPTNFAGETLRTFTNIASQIIWSNQSLSRALHTFSLQIYIKAYFSHIFIVIWRADHQIWWWPNLAWIIKMPRVSESGIERISIDQNERLYLCMCVSNTCHALCSEVLELLGMNWHCWITK